MTCASFGPINFISTQILWKLFVHVPRNFLQFTDEVISIYTYSEFFLIC